MLRGLVSAGLREADSFLESRFCLVQALFVEEPRAASGAGVYTAPEWSSIRHLLTEPFGPGDDRYGSDENYRRYLASIHESKILSVLSLMRAFDFGRYKRILELGCGDMPQAYVICSRFPEVAYTATDFDPHVIEACARLPLLSGIRKVVLDVTRDDLEGVLGNSDLVTSWSLEFSLGSEDLSRLFAACRQHSLPYLLCTHTAIGPISYLSRAYLQARRRKRTQADGARMLGWLRSSGEIARLARQAGMTLRSRAYHVNHAALLFTPA